MTAKSPNARDWFAARLAVITFAGLAVRVTWAIVERHVALRTDGVFYFGLADALSHGKGFIEPHLYLQTGRLVANANHTPAWPLLLTIPHLLGWNSLLPSQLLAAMVGTTTVAIVGFGGRAMAGPRVGLIAAAISAVCPDFWVYEHELMSETLALLLIALTVLVAYRYRDHASIRWAAGLGGLIGLLAMTHPNYLLLGPLLGAPLILGMPHAGRRRRLTQLGVAAIATVIVITPWVAFNARRFEQPVYMTTAFGLTLVDSNCGTTYSGARLGSWAVLCAYPIAKTNDAAVKDAAWRRRALHFVSTHLDRLPAVIAAREGRTWSVFRPLQQNHFDSSIGAPLWVERLRLLSYWLIAPFAIAGAVLLRRRRISLVAPLAFVALVTITVALSFGDTRYRAPAEVPIALLAAVAIAAIRPRKQRAV